MNREKYLTQFLVYFLMLMTLMVIGCTKSANISGTVTGDVSSGVLITLSGDYSESTTTDSSGSYSFTDLNDGNYTVTPSLAGYTFDPTSTKVSIANHTDQVANFSSTSGGNSSSMRKFAYAANSVTNNISVYTINESTGALTYVTSVAAGLNTVSVTEDTSGKFVYEANAGSGNI